MSIVTVKNKYQIVIPQKVRAQIGITIGDFLEATAKEGKIIFSPKSMVDRGIAQSLQEFKQGASYGPFNSHKQFIASLRKQTGKLAKKKQPRKTE